MAVKEKLLFLSKESVKLNKTTLTKTLYEILNFVQT